MHAAWTDPGAWQRADKARHSQHRVGGGSALAVDVRFMGPRVRGDDGGGLSAAVHHYQEFTA
jgi:hypothetical protein